jgi:hypothetical protein
MSEEIQTHLEVVDSNHVNGQGGSLWHWLRATFGHKNNDLIPSEQVLRHLGFDETRDLGYQILPLESLWAVAAVTWSFVYLSGPGKDGPIVGQALPGRIGMSCLRWC